MGKVKAETEDNEETQETLDTEETEADEAEGTEDADTEAAGEAEDEDAEDGAEDDGTGDGQDESDEVEIVREGETQPQATTPRGFLKRINKLNGRVDEAQQETSDERTRRLAVEDENTALKARLAQVDPQKEPDAPTIPNPDDFDGGVYDPAYLAAANKYNQAFISAEIQKGIAAATQQTTVTQTNTVKAHDLEKAQLAHIERATKLGVKDYEETEDKALEIFGHEKANHLIQNMENSELALYYLGKHPDIAQKYADMLDTKAIKALLELGGIVAGIKVKKSSKSKNLPDPDDELEGGVRLKTVKGKGPTFE